MATDAAEDTRSCIVLVDHEEQYSLRPVDREIPGGWSAVGILSVLLCLPSAAFRQAGLPEECLAY